jgi:hypothetical protein
MSFADSRPFYARISAHSPTNEEITMKRRFPILTLLILLSAWPQLTFAAPKKSTSGARPDKAFMQQIMTAWATMDPANVAKYYASGPHTFFDIAPLKYNSWDEYSP